MKYAELVAQYPARNQQWFNDDGQVRIIHDEFSNPHLELG
jgi:hypothetical protein